MANSPNPDLGPEERNLTSLDNLNITDAKLLKVPDNWTKLLNSDKARTLSLADFKFNLKWELRP
jgi:hypothetical protein